ncbi:Crp/Fnr family transcriptional regulator [Roseofilum capinflatum]|uniref:Cyclic nucleotide-binding domain-containing protein n=1 Tax=Roseofilum capinflatum BLCC-M114 TaxID=3022440 RepID=A0ABT7B4M3_9CYAN|nr:cyclic nucleotide-binding domain-containing protein [Roseofilum capinflatum]MDJ1173554.1 cyclic nucleotide-binding domain-containing protein [Roseofilum capinflatum BLCC-M114]
MTVHNKTRVRIDLEPDAMNYQQFEAFNHLKPEQIQDFLKVGKQGTIAASKRILKQNVLCRQIIFLLEGEVQVSLETSKGEHTLSTISAPTVLGEISFFSGEPSSATVTTLTQIKVLVIDFDVLRQRLIEGDRVTALILLNMSQALAKRASTMTRQLSEFYVKQQEMETQVSEVQHASTAIFGEWSFI